MSKLVFSKYNFIIEDDKEEEQNYILFNSISGAVFKVKEYVKNALQENTLNELGAKEIDVMKEKGILVPKEANELLKYEYRHNVVKHQSEVLSLTWLTTWDCNLNCTYCFEGEHKSKIKSSNENIDVMNKFIETQLANNKFKVLSLVLFGGEPLMNYEGIYCMLPKLKKICEENDVTLHVIMVSNGLLLTEERLKFLWEHNLKLIQITLDGAPEIHDTKRVFSNGKGTFKQTIQQLKLIKATVPDMQVVIRVNIDKENKETVLELLNLLVDEKLDNYQLDYGIIREEAKNCNSVSSICYSEEELGDTLYELWELAKAKGFNIKPVPPIKYIFCGLNGESAYTFTPELKFYKCWEHVGDTAHEFGFLDDDAKVRVTNDLYYEWMNKNPAKIKECTECKYLPNCGGGCSINSYNRYQTYQAPGCFATKGVLEKKILFALKNKQIQ